MTADLFATFRPVCHNTGLTEMPVHCNDTNEDLWGEYSDAFKDANGVRPRFFMTEDEVNAALPRVYAEIKRQIEAEKELEKERQKDRAFRQSIKDGSHPAFTTASATLEFNPFSIL
jgi:hypothetical protein